MPKNTSGLCYKCETGFFAAMTDTCDNCGAITACGGFKLCPKCAGEKNQCAFCGGALDAVKPPALPDERQVYMVVLKRDQKSSESREELLARTGESVDSFKTAVVELLVAQEQSPDAIEILSEMRGLGMVLIRCTSDLAAAVGNMPGVGRVGGKND